MLEVAFSRAGHLVRRMHQICQAIFLDETREFDLTSVQYSALNAIAEVPDIDQATLGKLIAFDKTTLVKVLDRLSDKGLITRVRSTRDRRRHILNATNKGRQVAENIVPDLTRSNAIFLAPLSEEEQVLFISLMTKIVEVNNGYSRVPVDKLLLKSMVRTKQNTEAKRGGQ